MTQPPSPAPDSVHTVRAEERLRVGVERVPLERVRFGKRVVTEERTVTVTVRREEFFLDRYADVAAVRDDPAIRDARSSEPVDLVLSEEQVEIVTRVVPRERVRVLVEHESGAVVVTEDLAREVVEVGDNAEWPGAAEGRPDPAGTAGPDLD